MCRLPASVIDRPERRAPDDRAAPGRRASRRRRRPERAPVAQDRVVRIGVEDPVVALAGRACSRRPCSRSRGRRRATARTRAWRCCRRRSPRRRSSLAIWTANGPTLPDAPTISTLSPGPTVRPSRGAAPAAQGSRHAARSRPPRTSSRPGSAANARSRSADVLRERPLPVHDTGRANTSSPGRKRVTPGPTSSTTPATSDAEAVVARPAQPQEQADERGLG